MREKLKEETKEKEKEARKQRQEKRKQEAGTLPGPCFSSDVQQPGHIHVTTIYGASLKWQALFEMLRLHW
jgi:hypothetical protein